MADPGPGPTPHSTYFKPYAAAEATIECRSEDSPSEVAGMRHRLLLSPRAARGQPPSCHVTLEWR